MNTSSQKRPSLGRGLSALLGESLPPTHNQVEGQITTLKVQQLMPGAYQPRSIFDDEKLIALIDSIREKGILQPLIVRPIDVIDGRFEIIAGERRWRAAKTLNFEEVPVIIRDCSDIDALEMAIIENVQRDDLNPLEEAEAYQKLMTQFHYTQDNVAKRIGKSRSYVANILRLNGLPGNVKGLILEGKISASHARALLNIENNDQLVQAIVSENLNVRDVEKRVREIKGGSGRRKSNYTPEKSEDILSLEHQLTHVLRAKTEIQLRDGVGTISILFNSYDELDDIMSRIRSNTEE